MTARPKRPIDPVQAFSRLFVEAARRSFFFFGFGKSGEPKSNRGDGSPQELKMKYLSALLVVLAVLTLGTTTLATTATAGEIYAPRNWDSGDGGIVSYGDPDGCGGGGIIGRRMDGSTATTYGNQASPTTDLKALLQKWILLEQYIFQANIRQSMRLW
jgi:hypothetical protein